MTDERRLAQRGGRAAAAVLSSAALFGLACPPWQVPLLAWIALVPFFAVVRELRPAHAAAAGLLWGTAAIWAVGYWVPGALAHYYEQPLWFGVLFALAASIVFAGSYAAGFAWCASWAAARTTGARRIAVFTTLWVSSELARARLLSGDPWLLSGYTLIGNDHLAQIADLGGVYALCFLVALVNASLAELLAARASRLGMMRLLAPSAIALLLSYGYGLYRLAVALPSTPVVPLTVVQANNDEGWQWREAHHGRGVARYVELSAAAPRNGPQLLIWPESAVTFFFARERLHRLPIERLLIETGADLIVGAPHYEDDDPAQPRYFNSAFHLTADGAIRARYDKAHLLPFAEYFPLRTIEVLRRQFERVRYFTPGDGDGLFETRFGTVATVICFEGIFPEIVREQMRRGGQLLVNLSNDAWLGSGAGPEQHLAMVALRAIENRTWVVRATTTGISAVVDPWGRIQMRSELLAPAVLHAQVVPLAVPTLYKRVGDAFAIACLTLAAAQLVVLMRRPSQQR
jgi:apolipoprotein N-acyltransferase